MIQLIEAGQAHECLATKITLLLPWLPTVCLFRIVRTGALEQPDGGAGGFTCLLGFTRIRSASMCTSAGAEGAMQPDGDAGRHADHGRHGRHQGLLLESAAARGQPLPLCIVRSAPII